MAKELGRMEGSRGEEEDGKKKGNRKEGTKKDLHIVFCDSILSFPSSSCQLAKFNPFVKDARKALLTILIFLEFDELDCHL